MKELKKNSLVTPEIRGTSALPVSNIMRTHSNEVIDSAEP
jgi:hypothetical protein